MFDGCNNLEYVDIHSWDFKTVSTLTRMFRYCSNLTTIDGIFDFVNFQTWNGVDDPLWTDMFKGCPKLRNVKVKNIPMNFYKTGLSESQYVIFS